MDGSPDLAIVLATVLANALWLGAVLGVAAAVSLRLMRHATPARRHAVGMTFLLAMLAGPVVQFAVLVQADGPINDGMAAAVAASEVGEAIASLFGGPKAASLGVSLFWGAGVLVFAARYGLGLRTLATLNDLAFAGLPEALGRRVDDLGRAMGLGASVAVRLADEIATPFVVGLARPVVWLPLSLLTRLPADQVEAILAHELAHIARRDWLWNGLQCVVETLLFFHPAVWWLGRRIRHEREQACDDLAASACGDPIALAEALATLEADRCAPELALAARGGPLLRRVTRLVGPRAPKRGWIASAGAAAAAVAMLVLAPAGMTGGAPHDLVVQASGQGPLTPGGYRQIRAHGDGSARFYRISMDARGRVTETYLEDGVARPIDAAVRAWIAAVSGPPPAHLPPPA